VRRERLTMLKTELERMLQLCGHGGIAECRVIEVLADHSKYVSHSQSGAAKSRSASMRDLPIYFCHQAGEPAGPRRYSERRQWPPTAKSSLGAFLSTAAARSGTGRECDGQRCLWNEGL
jgi:hypothetical protein